MLNYLKDLFITNTESVKKDDNANPHKLKIAACALMLEIASADDDFSEEEKDRIIQLMKDKFELSDLEVTNIISISEEEINTSVSIYEFTDVLNKNLNSAEKYLLLKNLWHIAYADGNLDSYEDYFIKKISNNLHFHNKDRIAAKMEVKKELGL
jgi:uncharacterized tellurite resistance protein B-like protein